LAVLTAKGCVACHSVDGKPKVGPTLKALFGREQQVLAAGIPRNVRVDEAYVRRAITDPSAEVVHGYPKAMPQVPLTEQELTDILTYLKTLN
jgi:cytochrome c oxidase subunit 2